MIFCSQSSKFYSFSDYSTATTKNNDNRLSVTYLARNEPIPELAIEISENSIYRI
jgi:hypothetical protein